jgi:hypothetical protein
MKIVFRNALIALPLAGSLGASALYAQTTAPPKGASSQAPAATAPASPAGESAGKDFGVPPPAHPITLEQTREMLHLMGYKKLMTEMMDQNFAMQKQAAPFIPADVWSDLQTSFNNVDYAQLLEPVYAKYISQEDAAKALDFYRTPAGQAVLKAQPMLMREVIVASQQNAQKTGREVIQKHRAEIEAAQKQFQEQQQKQSGAAGAGSGAGAGATPHASGGGATTPAQKPAPPQ